MCAPLFAFLACCARFSSVSHEAIVFEVSHVHFLLTTFLHLLVLFSLQPSSRTRIDSIVPHFYQMIDTQASALQAAREQLLGEKVSGRSSWCRVVVDTSQRTGTVLRGRRCHIFLAFHHL